MVYQSPNLTPMPIDANGRTIEDVYRNIQSGNGTVTTAGTPVRLTSSATESKSVDIYNPNSAALLFIGGSSVLHSPLKGIPLQVGFTYRLSITDLSNVWVDSDTNGATFSFTYQW